MRLTVSGGSGASQLGGHRRRPRRRGRRLVLTHLWPTTDPAAARTYPGPLDVATPGLTLEV